MLTWRRFKTKLPWATLSTWVVLFRFDLGRLAPTTQERLVGQMGAFRLETFALRYTPNRENSIIFAVFRQNAYTA